MLSKIILTGFIFSLCVNLNVKAEVNEMFSTDTVSVMGDSACFAVKEDGSLWSWGINEKTLGILGNGTFTESKEPQKILDNVKSTAGCYAIKEDGSLWGWGMAYEKAAFGSPVPVHIADSIKGVVYANGYVLYINNDGSLWGMGSNFEGALGQKDINGDYNEPFKIMNNVVSAAAGYDHTVLLKTDGSVVTFGGNNFGQIGNGTREDTYLKNHIMDNVKYINAGISSSFAIDDNNVLWRWGTNYGNGDCLDYDNPALIKTEPEYYMSDVKAMNSHVGYNVVLKTNGELWIYGEDETEQRCCTNSSSSSRAVYFDLPVKLMDNVADISDSVSGYLGPSLIITNDGELYEYELVETEPYVGEIRINKIMDNVRIPINNSSLYKNKYTDISDLPENTYYCVDHLSRAGIIDGITDNEFMPEKDITRAEAAAIILRMTGKSEEKSVPEFKDVSNDKWYYNIAGTSQKYGLISGFDDGTFKGDEKLSYAEAVSLAARALRSEGTAVEPEEYSDTDFSNVPEWAKEDIKYAVDHGIITEKELGRIYDDRISRGDAACIFYKLYELM